MTDLELYREYQRKLKNYTYALFIIGFDYQTVCPKKDKENSNNVQNYFYEEIIKITSSDDYFHLLVRLKDEKGLDEIEALAIKKEYENIFKQRRLPVDLITKGIKLQSDAELSWEMARETLDFSDFEEKLERVLDYNFETLPYLKDKYDGFDIILTEMEDDFTEEKYDALFNKIEEEILPLVKKILAMPKKYNLDLTKEKFDIDKQRKLTKRICDLMGYTNEVGYIGETIHPFTNGINSNDVRTTTKYDESLLFSNLYSVMHEVGHATYELQNDPRFSETALMGGASCALHESQSRFYENYLGRSREFIEFLYPILKEIYPEQMAKYTLDDIYYYANDVSNQFTRTEADELTYPFHIIIRYKIEKELFHKKITVKDISSRFNELFYEYFGTMPKDKKEGCYQDIHWTSGFGYFPTYALGSAMSSQFLASMEKDFNPFLDMKNGDFRRVNAWLKEHIHKYGMSKKNLEIVKIATGEDFNPKYYIDYLKNKFKKIYEI